MPARQKQAVATFDLDAEIKRLTKKFRGNAEAARIAAESKAERLKLGLTPEQYLEYEEQREAEERARETANREAAKKAEEEAEAAERARRAASRRAAKGVQADEIAALTAQAQRVMWPDPASLPGPERNGAQKKTKRPAPAGNRSGWDGGWFRVFNSLVDSGLLGAMPAPAAKAYMTCLRYAGIDGSFFISHQTLAQKIGAKRREYGQDVMHLLREAGLVKLIRAGVSNRASDYRLALLDAKTIEKAKAAMPARERGRKGGVKPKKRKKRRGVRQT